MWPPKHGTTPGLRAGRRVRTCRGVGTQVAHCSDQSRRYADPYTILRVLEGSAIHHAEEHLVRRLTETEHDLHITQIDRERNYCLKMEMESYLRRLEHSRRIRRGTTDRLIKRIIG